MLQNSSNQRCLPDLFEHEKKTCQKFERFCGRFLVVRYCLFVVLVRAFYFYRNIAHVDASIILYHHIEPVQEMDCDLRVKNLSSGLPTGITSVQLCLERNRFQTLTQQVEVLVEERQHFCKLYMAV